MPDPKNSTEAGMDASAAAVDVEKTTQVKHPREREADRQQELKEKAEKIVEETVKLPATQRPMEDVIRENLVKLKDVYKTCDHYLHINDYRRIDLLLATALSNQIPGTPIWIFIVGNSGDWKSAFARSFEGLDNCMKLDQITKNTLASGMKGNDLGALLNNNSTILLFPDLASLTSMNRDDKNAIWGQMRNLYDGFINKRTGNDVHRAYENCHVTIIACTTPAIRDEVLVHAQLGTRELLYDTRADSIDDDDKMDAAWKNENVEDEMREKIDGVVLGFMRGKKIKNIKISDDIRNFLKSEAKRLKILRVGGATDRMHRELLNALSPEVPTRLIKQFKRIYICLKSLEDDYPDKYCKEIISRIVDSTGNPVRQLIMDVCKDKDDWLEIRDVTLATRLGRVAVKAQLEMLWNLDVIDKKFEEKRIGGYVWTSGDGTVEEERGGRVEEVAKYRFKKSQEQQKIDDEREQKELDEVLGNDT